MIINTTRLGKIEIPHAPVLEMPEGMLDFAWCKRFALVEDKPDTPFKWLQALDDPSVAFIVANPTEFFPDYQAELADNEAEMLELSDPADAALVTTVTVDKKAGCVTTNLLGRILTNSRNLKAKQIVLNGSKYGTKHVIGLRKHKEATSRLARPPEEITQC